ncbi:M81 family metallopeptidase [Permianibacter sp. IMCC34836]|uniref:M81 family metallopeptidase n=1 Tax=Permianibacter fluminis TaxID=2738515 RepID=UPI0015580A26|nr:M81 family metallopeptidase [Permianibacter fluminis]NQD37822.1 M81 family metallopeptidase [Permianibacter fluminis]
MARIGVAGFLHETNTFAQSRATLADFIEADAWPGLLRGQAVLTETAGINLATAGFVAAMANQHSLQGLLWASCGPSGLVTREAYETLWQWTEAELSQALPLDALFLDLHGAMVAEHVEDGEGEWLRRIRHVVGDIPIVATLDFHANISAAMVEHASVMLVYRSYPHVDMAETGARAAQILQRLLNGERCVCAWRQLPFLVSLPWQCTSIAPMRELQQQLLRMSSDVWSAECAPGFPLADVPDCGPSLLVYASESRAAETGADRLRDLWLAARPAFRGELWSLPAAVQRAAQHHKNGLMILAETQDNPGGGGDSDGTQLVHEWLRQQAGSACMGLIHDPAVAAQAHAAGVGAELEVSLGAKHNLGSGPPLTARVRVEALGDGKFAATGPFYRGSHMALGLMARLSYQGLQLLVSSRKQQAADQAMLRHLGIEPAQQRVLILKSSVHFRADFESIASEILITVTPGCNTADLSTLAYRRLRPGVTPA